MRHVQQIVTDCDMQPLLSWLPLLNVGQLNWLKQQMVMAELFTSCPIHVHRFGS